MFNVYMGRYLRFYIEVNVLCDKSSYLMFFNDSIYYYVSVFIWVIPLPNMFNFVIVFLFLFIDDDLPLDIDDDDDNCEIATLLNYYDCDCFISFYDLTYKFSQCSING